MNIHEYQAKSLLSDYGVKTLKGEMVRTVDQAEKAASKLNGPIWVVKAQIHAGGRGKAGGVKVVHSLEAVREATEGLLGSVLVTHQTGPEGKKVQRIYIEEGCEIESEFYLSMLIDRAVGRVTIVASAQGGVDIEEVAWKSPRRILKIDIDPVTGYRPHHGLRIASAFGLKNGLEKNLGRFLRSMSRAFHELDCSQIELNPLALTKSGEIIALDAKIVFDDNALFRHKAIAELRDEDEEEASELEAGKQGLNYVKLNGNIGCMVNGAGLAMATMDIIKLYGGEPANFLDVGGGATKERVTSAFKLILNDPKVKAILVNIFGGIMRCDSIAEGIIDAAREIQLDVPLVVRLEGTNVDIGKKILRQSGLDIISASSMEEAAKKIVDATSRLANRAKSPAREKASVSKDTVSKDTVSREKATKSRREGELEKNFVSDESISDESASGQSKEETPPSRTGSASRKEALSRARSSDAPKEETPSRQKSPSVQDDD